MKFESIPKNEIVRMIEHCYLSGNSSLLIVLIDGTALCAHISGQAWGGKGLIPASEVCFSLKNHLEVEINLMHDEHSVYVPFNQIAGISILPYSQEEIETREAARSDSAYRKLCHDLMGKAKRHSFKIKRHFVAYGHLFRRPFKWGNISFGNDTPLYCDWDFLSKTCGGLNSLGAGFVVSFSAGWKNSLMASFKNKVKHRRTEIGRICSKKEAVVSGFVQFVKFDETAFAKSEQKAFLEMESAKWCAAVISSTRVKHKKQFRNVSWALAYFNETSFMFPKSLWESFSQEIRIYGEVIPVTVRTELGKKSCFFKVRAAAYIKLETQENEQYRKMLTLPTEFLEGNFGRNLSLYTV